MILSADSISKSFSKGSETISVFQDLSLEVEAGDLITIIGPSGAGKSTLLNILGTLDTPDSGTVSIRGERTDTMEDADLANLRNTSLGFVFQFHHLLPEFTALENIIIPAEINQRQDSSQQKALELLDYVGLADRKNHYPSELSGGERSRVAVLRALINDPDIVFADEPTGNLDAENAQKLMDLIQQLNRDRNQAFLIATHNADVADIGTRKLVLKDRSLSESGIL
jgi:lipoprotein-releasing system ATP-binding protein